MKLSQLKAYIAQIEAARLPENEDPSITFWLPRVPSLLDTDSNESYTFIELVLDESAHVNEHRIAHTDNRVVQGRGDFTIPLLRVPFYK